MGTWSKPLFATVSPGTPDDYEIVLSELPTDQVHAWKNAAFFESNTSTYTLSEFMNTGCDTHKIMDHMNNNQIYRWLSLFSYLAKKYPVLNEVAFHFYCSDDHKAYYFMWKRQKDGESPIVLKMHVGSYDSVYYFTIDPEHPRRLVFHKDMYLHYWTILPHEIYELVPGTGLF
jgi:hypothetical protein